MESDSSQKNIRSGVKRKLTPNQSGTSLSQPTRKHQNCLVDSFSGLNIQDATPSTSRNTPSPVSPYMAPIWFPGDSETLDHESEGNGPSDSGVRMREHNSSTGASPRKLPTVFKWDGGGKSVYISGSFDNWKSKIHMAKSTGEKSHGDFYTIVDLPEGTHQYKFLVDGVWLCDTHEPKVENGLGSENNEVTVRSSDFEVFEALAMDSLGTGHPDKQSGGTVSPPGEYSQFVPPRNTGPGYHHGGPPILPPHLLQVILNKETSQHCEPTLLPEPNHVMLNHLYALSIKDGVMVLSATHRYRKKYVTTLLYKPI